MNWVKQNWFKLGIITSIGIIAMSIAYYLVVFLPQQKSQNLSEIKTNTSTDITPITKVDPQIKIEKCKAISDTQAQQELQTWVTQNSNAELQYDASTVNALCQQGDYSCMDAMLPSLGNAYVAKKEAYYQERYRTDYLKCLSI